MDKLKYEDIVKEFKFKITEGLGMFFGIGFHILLETEFDFDVYLPTYGYNLQREYVWTQEQKTEFILSCIKGITKGMTPFCLIQINDGTGFNRVRKYQVIDGKQRLMTLIGFVRGDFSIDFNGKKYFRDDLDKRIQYEISRHSILSNIAYDFDGLTDDDKLERFKRVNFAGTPMDKEHLNKFVK